MRDTGSPRLNWLNALSLPALIGLGLSSGLLLVATTLLFITSNFVGLAVEISLLTLTAAVWATRKQLSCFLGMVGTGPSDICQALCLHGHAWSNWSVERVASCKQQIACLIGLHRWTEWESLDGHPCKQQR